MGREMEEQQGAFDSQMDQAQRQIDAQQRQIEMLQQQKQQQPQTQQEDHFQKLKKYGELRQQGIITEEEFQKLKETCYQRYNLSQLGELLSLIVIL
jgi:multidrug resistance efflux pump